MTTQPDSAEPSILGKLILTRMIAGKSSPTRSVFVKNLKEFFPDRLRGSDKDWKDLVHRTLEELAAAKRITHPKTKIEITDAGLADVRTFLGVDDLPKGLRWDTLKKRYLFPLALGRKPSTASEKKNADTGDGLKAALLVKLFDLGRNPYPTLPQAIKMLLAKQGALLKGNGQGHVCDALMKQWISEQNSTAVYTGREANEPQADLAPSKPEPQATNLPDGESLDTFVKKVRTIAAALQGNSPVEKVLISRIWRRFQDDGTLPMTREQFDQNLLISSREQRLVLSRSDLPAGIDPDERRESELHPADGDPFHFVRTDRT